MLPRTDPCFQRTVGWRKASGTRHAVRRMFVAAAVFAGAVAPAQASSRNVVATAFERASGFRAMADDLRTELDSGNLARTVGAVNELGKIPTMTPPASEPTADALAATISSIQRAVGAIETARAAYGDKANVASHDARSTAFAVLDSKFDEPTSPELAARLTAARNHPATQALMTATSSAALDIAAQLDRLIPELNETFAPHVPGNATRVGTVATGFSGNAAPTGTVARDVPGKKPPRGNKTSAACDVYDATPLLCISGSGADVPHIAAALLIDLGGNDKYTSSVAAPSVLSCTTGGPECSVSIIIDVSGDDLYAPEIEAATGHQHLVAIGAAWQGVGMLIDADGNDRYLVDVPDRDQPLRESFMMGSGNIGFGLLADFDGNDSYVVTSNSDDLLEPYAQGAALSGAGALIDLGGRNEYGVSIKGMQAGPTPGIDATYDDYYGLAHGVALFGGAALLDRTGRATFGVDLDITGGAADVTNIASVIAQSVSIVGGSALLTGSGSTVYRGLAKRTTQANIDGDPQGGASLMGGAGVTAQSVTVLGISILDDAGGNDSYEARANSNHVLESTGSNGLLTLSKRHDDEDHVSSAGVSVQALASDLFAPDAFALLSDRGGDDRYIARARLDATVTVVPDSGPADAKISWESYDPYAGAYGQALSAGVPAFLVDTSGDDTYALTANGTSTAHAIGDENSTAMAYSPLTGTSGQATNYLTEPGAALFDLGGQDSYRAEAIGRANTNPTPQRAYDLPRIIDAQGAAGGIFVDVDDLVVDSFSQSPAGQSLTGHGEGSAWVDSAAGVALAPGQPAKQASTLVFDPSNPESLKEGVLQVRAHLDSGGPVSGEEVTFQIDVQGYGLIPRWDPHPISSHAFTDVNGDVVGLIDLDAFNSYWRDWVGAEPAELTLRITAKWAGDATHRAVEASTPFAVSL